jgi:hypothetical protein
VVGAGEGVVHRLVLDDHCAVIGNNVAVEVVDGGLVLEEGRRQLGGLTQFHNRNEGFEESG